jgi:fumarate reductase subunit C
LNNHDYTNIKLVKSPKTRQRLKDVFKFGIIAAILFAAISVVSILFVDNCSDINNCFLLRLNINKVIIFLSLVGLVWCLYNARDFNKKIDTTVKKLKD